MLAKLDPPTVKQFEAVQSRARKFAEDQLKTGMLRARGGNYTAIAGELMDTTKWLSHGQMISSLDAAGIGLVIKEMDPTSTLWRQYWQPYCLQRLAIEDNCKLFESDHASLPVQGHQ
jgi:hypothetical protein